MTPFLSLRRKGTQGAHDDRILGSSDFVSRLLGEAEAKEKETLRLSLKASDLDSLAKEIVKREGIEKNRVKIWEQEKGSTEST